MKGKVLVISPNENKINLVPGCLSGLPAGICSNYTDDMPYSWTAPPYHPPTQEYMNAAVCPGEDGGLHRNLVCPVHVPSQPEASLPDIQIADHAVQILNNRSVGGYKVYWELLLILMGVSLIRSFPRRCERSSCCVLCSSFHCSYTHVLLCNFITCRIRYQNM